MDNELTFAEPGTKEWDAIWTRMKELVGDFEAEHDGEAWQYMGTVHVPHAKPVHEFRHRCHPATNDRVLLRFDDAGWFRALTNDGYISTKQLRQ